MILITGARGFIGRFVVRRFIDMGEAVVTITGSSTHYY